MACHAGFVPQGQEHVVVGLLPRPARRQFRVRDRGGSEKLHCLVQQVGAEVEQHAAAVVRRRLRFPGLGDRRGPALKAGFEPRDGAEGTAVQQPSDGQVVAVPAPVLEDREHAAQPLCEPDEFLALGAAHRKRLVDDDVEPGFQRGLREGVVRGRRGSEDQQVKFAGELKDVRRGVHDPGTGVPGGCGGLPAGVGSGDHVERVRGVGREERGVEDAARKAEAGHGSSDGPGVMLSWLPRYSRPPCHTPC